MMKRRDFLQTTAVAALGAPAIAHATPAPEQDALHPAIAALKSRTADAPPPISDAERAERRAGAQRLMAEQKVDALFVESGATLIYFTGIPWGRSERVFGMLLPREGDAIIVSPAFEQQRAEALVRGRFTIRAWDEDQSPYTLIADALKGWGSATGTLLVDESARYFIPHGLAHTTPALRIGTATPITETLRGAKSAHEIDIMRFANAITLDAFRAALQTLRDGMTQGELGRNLAQAFVKQGYPGGALVLFGESSAYPHGVDKPEVLRTGQVVLVDGGTSVHDYDSDITRTVVFGTASAEQQKVFDIVREAQARALKAAAPGKKAGDIDTVARRYIEEAGYGPGYKYFTHRLGHGIGLEGHEWPYLVKGSQVVLRPGMSFSNEPGIYQYGKFGVRLEDIMVITDSAAELLTPPATSLSPALH